MSPACTGCSRGFTGDCVVREGKLFARSVAKSILDTDAPSARGARAPLMQLRPGASCGATEFEVCIDSTGRITVPGAKRFLPDLPGLKPERLTVRRSGVILGYSF